MTNVPFPMITTPGQHPMVAGGRLINCYPETLAANAGLPYAYWRVAGLSTWGTAPSGVYRGGIAVKGTFYAIFGSTLYSFTSVGGAGTPITGTIAGTGYCWLSANQATTPDIVIVSPGSAVYWLAFGAGAVSAYPDANVTNFGTPNGVTYMNGFFIFTVGSGTTFVSAINGTAINLLNFATAQSKPDTLYRAMPLGSGGQLLLIGSNTIEVWGSPINPTGYPFSYVSTIYRGVVNAMAIAGDEDGWGKGLFFVSDDNKVSTLTTYTPTPISVPDLDQLIEAEPDESKISIGVYVSRGHGMVAVQGPTWCWEYDTTLGSWHERQSYLQTYWRGYAPRFVFTNWICGDFPLGASPTASLFKIDGHVRNEVGQPLRMRLETGPMGAFPRTVRINEINVYLTKGASIAVGHDPDETNAAIEVSCSRNSGQTWSNPRQLPIGPQSIMGHRARASIWGSANIEGVRWRFDESAGLNFAFMGADMETDVLR
jgi:hypothetical protein